MSRLTETRPVRIIVVDERGEPLGGAKVALPDRDLFTDDAGEALIGISEPVTAVVSFDGTLDEPVAIGADDLSTTIRLWDRVGPKGIERTSMHFGGDVMLGRRYLESDRYDTPLVTDAESARSIVNDLAPISRSADWTVVNLESVIGELPVDEAYPGKRFLLQSSPLVTETLDELGVDLVTQGNNHAYDWEGPGIDSTFKALEDAGVAHVGAGVNPSDAVRGRLVEVSETMVGIVSYTTVNGSFVNDQLPPAGEQAPVNLPAADRWQFGERKFSFGSVGDEIHIPSGERRIGEVWSEFSALEKDLGSDAVSDLWAALREVFPELQDWVARRGHGGAAAYRRTAMESEIARLELAGAEMTIVQVHGGFQFAEFKSEFVQQIAYDAIDAGADLVVAHHPHVLQGVEWYRDKLVVYSLGNLVFDQDFLGTFPSAILRVITEGSEVLEARMIPIMIDRYRPVPVTGQTAAQIIRKIDQRTAQPAVSARLGGIEVGAVLSERERPGGQSASLQFERNSGIIVTGRRERQQIVDIGETGTTALAACTVVRSDVLSDTTELGVDLFASGRFDDDTADGQRERPLNWTVPAKSGSWRRTSGRTLNPLDDSIELITDPDRKTTIRILARVDIDEHRLFDLNGDPVDDSPRLEILLDVKRVRGEVPNIRFVTFDFRDSDPTSSPETTRMREINVPIEVPDDGLWHSVTIPLPRDLFAPEASGNQANTATLLIDSPAAWLGRLAVDNVRIIEWRGATSADRPTWTAADFVRSEDDSVRLTTSGC